MDFNEKLIQLRRAKGFSQEQLADLINVSRQAISKWETADSQPDLAKLILLCEVFEVSLDELCGRPAKTTKALPIAPTKNRSRFLWLFTSAIIFSLLIGVIVGIFSSGIIFPAATRQEIKNFSMTSFYINPELYNHKLHLVFCPSITAAPGQDDVIFSCKVLKIDTDGKTSSYPAVLTEGVWTSDVSIDELQSNFTLNAVISDGTYNYTVGLVKISDLKESSYSYEELWQD
jgi:transcriptional regulator with XRE-family HTH domain